MHTFHIHHTIYLYHTTLGGLYLLGTDINIHNAHAYTLFSHYTTLSGFYMTTYINHSISYKKYHIFIHLAIKVAITNQPS